MAEQKPEADPADAKRKLEFLIRHSVPRRVLGHEPNMASFAEKLGVARKTLIDQRDKDNVGVLSSYVQGALANKLKFSLAWDEWLNSTAAEFEGRYCKEHADTVVGKPDAPPRSYDPSVRLKSIALVPPPRPEGEPEKPNFASLTLFLRQSNQTNASGFEVDVELICMPEPIGAFEIAIRRGRLEIDPGAGGIAREAGLLGFDEPVTFDKKDRTLTLRAANSPDPKKRAWLVESDKGPIGVLRLPDDHPLCRLAEPAPGDTISATFKVWVKDLVLAEPVPGDDEDDDARKDPFSFLRPDGKPLSAAKRQIIKTLLLREELGSNPGWIEVAADMRRIDRDAE